MKKGDIVKLKEGACWSQAEAQSMGYKNPSDVPEFFEVESVGMRIICCIPIAMFTIDGIKCYFTQNAFEVALPAGEPDVAKLLEESKQMEKAWIGM